MSVMEPADGADEYLRSQDWHGDTTPQEDADFDHVAFAVHAAVVEHLTEVLSPKWLQAALDSGQGLRTTINLALSSARPKRLKPWATTASSPWCPGGARNAKTGSKPHDC